MSVQIITKNGKRRYRWHFDRIVEGERVRRSKVLPIGTSRADAEAIGRAWDAEVFSLAHGTSSEEPTLGECVRRHIKDKNSGWKDRHKRVAILEKWRPEYEDASAGDLHAWSVQFVGYLRASTDRAGRKKRPLSDGSARNILAYIRAAVRYCHKIGMVKVDDSRRLAIPAVANERHNYPDRAQMLSIAKLCGDRQTRAAIRVAFYSGMRQAEILRAVVTKRGYSLGVTKNGTPRIVPIHPRIAVIARRVHFSITADTLKYWWNKARSAAGYPTTRFHDLRHSSASEMVNAGVDLYTIGGVLGHKSVASTKRYSHLVTSHLESAIFQIGRKK